MSAVDVIIRTGDTHAIGHHSSCRRHGDMRALTLVADRQLATSDIPAPPPPGAGEVQIRVKAVALNHIDVWGYRGMAFAMESRQVFGKIVVGF
jgi:alcohol dehydrogenase